MKVLVVHRHEEFTQTVTKHLEQWSVTRAHTGLEGLLATRVQRYDLVLSSFNLPVVTGIEMVRSLRILSAYTNVPVVMLAEGFESSAHIRLAKRLNANLLSLAEVYEMQNLEVAY